MPRGSSAPGEPIGSGFSALIFFGSFLYQDKKERLACSLPKFCSRLFVSYLSRPFRACKIVRSIQGLRPLLLITPLRGLNHQTSFAGRRTSSVRLPTSSAGSRASSEIRNPPLGGRVLKPTSLYPLLFLIITPGNRPGRSCRLNPVNIMPGNQLLKIMATFAIGSKIVYSKIF